LFQLYFLHKKLFDARKNLFKKEIIEISYAFERKLLFACFTK